jgi:hypothetical protein
MYATTQHTLSLPVRLRPFQQGTTASSPALRKRSLLNSRPRDSLRAEPGWGDATTSWSPARPWQKRPRTPQSAQSAQRREESVPATRPWTWSLSTSKRCWPRGLARLGSLGTLAHQRRQRERRNRRLTSSAQQVRERGQWAEQPASGRARGSCTPDKGGGVCSRRMERGCWEMDRREERCLAGG